MVTTSTPASAAEHTQGKAGWQRSLRQQQRPPVKQLIISTQGSPHSVAAAEQQEANGWLRSVTQQRHPAQLTCFTSTAAAQIQDTAGWPRSLRQQQRPPVRLLIISTQGRQSSGLSALVFNCAQATETSVQMPPLNVSQPLSAVYLWRYLEPNLCGSCLARALAQELAALMQGSNCTAGTELPAIACSAFVCALDAVPHIQKVW
ncbi:hypothetical protein WJX77_006641 [Trebouxia sp. C0004]